MQLLLQEAAQNDSLEAEKSNVIAVEFSPSDVGSLYYVHNGISHCSQMQNRLPVTAEHVIANCYSFLLAGYETTSTALAFTAWLLAKHPDVQTKLQREIDENFPGGEVKCSQEQVYTIRMPSLFPTKLPNVCHDIWPRRGDETID